MKFIDSEIMERYLRGESDAHEKQRVLMWLLLNLKTPSADEEFTALLNKVPSTDDTERKQRVKSRLDSLVAAEKPQTGRHARKGVMAVMGCLLAAACVAITFLAGNLIETRNGMNRVVSWTEASTSYGEKLSVTLPDSSVIWLHNDTKLIYPDSFHGGVRQVFVSGEVYADITKNEDCPFVVSSDSVNVVVTGTTFNFRAYPDMTNVEVTLIEGAVALDCVTKIGRQNMDIVPGETVIVNMNSGNVSKYVSEPQKYVSWKERRALYFNDQTLDNIVKELQREFGCHIVIVDKALGNTRHFASFVNEESVMDILSALCTHSGMRIEERNSTIYIYNN